ncbi:MAG: N-acetylmuramoyl-L-alanine amidase [Lachnospiraceae bacterium]|nr:N-acetylmuramoyl-L-alanine amidase [Lachnospiraceae bacterium]
MKEKKGFTSLFPVLISGALFLAVAVLFFCASTGIIRAEHEGKPQYGQWHQITDSTLDTVALKERVYDRRSFLTIPLPDGVGEEDIRIEDDYLNQCIRIKIPGCSESFFQYNYFSGDMTHIQNIRLDEEEGIVLNLEGIYAPEAIYEPGRLFIRAVKARDLYDRIVVIDAGHGGEDEGSAAYGIREKDITFQTAAFLETELSERGIKVYHTHTAEYGPTEEERATLIEGVDPDLIIGLHTDADGNTRTTVGERVVTRPGLEDKAERLLSALTDYSGRKNLGVSTEKAKGLFGITEKPLYAVRLGFITNRAEAELMGSADFQRGAAEALAGAVSEIITAE